MTEVYIFEIVLFMKPELLHHKNEIYSFLKNKLYIYEEIEFAIVHGSFLDTKNYNDIDIALYVNDTINNYIDYELNLETKVTLLKVLPCAIDIKILNEAPLAFKYNAIKNPEILFHRDKNNYCEFREITIRDYLDFSYCIKNYLRTAHEYRL